MQLCTCFTQNTLSNVGTNIVVSIANINRQSSDFMFFSAAELHAAIHSHHDISMWHNYGTGQGKRNTHCQTLFTGYTLGCLECSAA